MPQMAPLSWSILFITFSLSFMMFNMMNFFSFNVMPEKSSKKSMTSKPMAWKW